MPLVRVREDVVAGTLVRELLLERLAVDVARCGGDAELLGDGRGLLSMVPVYTLSLAVLRRGHVSRGINTGWRYLWSHPDLGMGASIDIRRLRDGEPELGRYSWGKAAPRLATAFREVEERYGDDTLSYQPRLLRLQAPAMEAIWLKPARGGGAGKLHGLQPGLNDDAFLACARERLQILGRGKSGRARRRRAAAPDEGAADRA